MSLAIDPAEVTEVLLADGWHKVGKNDLFLVEDSAFTFKGEDGDVSVGPGFALYDSVYNHWTGGPLSSVLAVRYPESTS